MCSPAQLRQQSEELYAVIDEILANSIPAVSQKKSYELCTNVDFKNDLMCLFLQNIPVRAAIQVIDSQCWSAGKVCFFNVMF